MGLKLTILAAAIAFVASAFASRVDLGAGPRPTSAANHANEDYASLLHGLDQRIVALEARANDRSDDWLTRMHLGAALLERASSTQRIQDFERVQAVLDEAFAIAPEGSGPLLLAARFNFAIHRLGVAEDYLDRMDRRVLQRTDEQLAARVLRAEIALQRGQYDAALTGFTEVAQVMPEAAAVELALYHAKTGRPDQAEVLLDEALASASPKDHRRRAWTRLQLGLLALDRGASLVALEQLQQAEAELPGWWLVQEHVAEVYDRIGDHERAIAIYERLVTAVDLPQHMDALATAHQHAGEPEQARVWIERAETRWQEQLARLPEAAMGHGLQHYLQFGPPEQALALAESNFAVRPGGEAQVLLARAYLQAGEPAKALDMAQRTLATPYRTAGLHDVAARAHAALGHSEDAQAHIELRAALDPSYQGREHTH